MFYSTYVYIFLFSRTIQRGLRFSSTKSLDGCCCLLTDEVLTTKRLGVETLTLSSYSSYW